jgi:hypothetical protein
METEKEVFEGRGVMSRREALMIVGLVLATIFVIMRCVAGEWPGWHIHD